MIDGNYTRAIPVKWAEIDTVIWLDLPFPVNLYRSVRRAVQRAWAQQDLWETRIIGKVCCGCLVVTRLFLVDDQNTC